MKETNSLHQKDDAEAGTFKPAKSQRKLFLTTLESRGSVHLLRHLCTCYKISLPQLGKIIQFSPKYLGAITRGDYPMSAKLIHQLTTELHLPPKVFDPQYEDLPRPMAQAHKLWRYETPGKRIKAIRKYKFRMTTRAFAKSIGINYANLSKIENDKMLVSFNSGRKIAAFTKIPLNMLYEFQPFGQCGHGMSNEEQLKKLLKERNIPVLQPQYMRSPCTTKNTPSKNLRTGKTPTLISK